MKTNLRVYNGWHRKRREPEPEVMAIKTGLSVAVCGHVLRMECDDAERVARLVIEVAPGHVVTGLEYEAVRGAAELLVARARRFLGLLWSVDARAVGRFARPAKAGA